MKKKKERKKIREFLKFIKMNRKAQIVTAVLACGILAGVSITVYSKYYKTGYNPGMAVASGFYFNSNYMAAVDDLKNMTIDEMIPIIDDDILETIIRSANDLSWSEGEAKYTFNNIEVRNYDNYLLYNDKDLDVGYEVYFMLLDEPKGAKYFIKDQSTQVEYELFEWGNTEKIVRFKGTLDGGTPNLHTYELSIDTSLGPDGSTYEPVDVLMIAYPTDPYYLKGSKAIAGILRANQEEKKFKIEPESGFAVRREKDYYENDYEKWQETVLKESGYEYQVYTSGNYTGSGSATRRTIQVKWRKDLYQINQNDYYYQRAIATSEDTQDCRLLSDETDEDGHTWAVMEIDVLPFASLKFVFFRSGNNDFETIIESMDRENDFEKSVQVSVVGDEDEDENSGNP